jgi:plastocyanin
VDVSLLRFGVAAVVAGVAVAAASVPARAQPAAPTVITVQLSEYKFSPVEIDLDHGQSYVLRVVNTGGKAHDLSAKAFFQSVTLAPASASEVKDGAVELAMGESADVALATGAPGTYEMHCTHPLHSMLGMKGRIVVR